MFFEPANARTRLQRAALKWTRPTPRLPKMKTSRMSPTSLAAAIAILSSVAGCAHEETKPVVAPTSPAVATPTSALPTATPGKADSAIYLSDRLRKACAITTVESVKEAPKFEFDQQAILAEDRDVLALVAQCLTTGPLKGHSVKLVGRSDPRGAQQYNMALGERRANAVMHYLAGLGVGAPQMSETSRGALDASGNDESTWRLDRRVDIDVADGGQ
jgi:peptidoglycan-associated lipoprotein